MNFPIIIIFLSLISCSLSNPLEIRILTSLSCPYAGSGLESRKGDMPAIDRLNKNGGIRGRKFHAVYALDESNMVKALEAVKALYNSAFLKINSFGYTARPIFVQAITKGLSQVINQ